MSMPKVVCSTTEWVLTVRLSEIISKKGCQDSGIPWVLPNRISEIIQKVAQMIEWHCWVMDSRNSDAFLFMHPCHQRLPTVNGPLSQVTTAFWVNHCNIPRWVSLSRRSPEHHSDYHHQSPRLCHRPNVKRKRFLNNRLIHCSNKL